jgi:putative transposon-encoded protein|tara:strand:+ start:2723 stop:2980 length:258 start_codon:yes stop_codon:yes gene_type:complete
MVRKKEKTAIEIIKNRVEKHEKLLNTMGSLKKMMDKLENKLENDEILMRVVSQVGNSGRIAVPSKHIGKKARVIILKKKEDKKED